MRCSGVEQHAEKTFLTDAASGKVDHIPVIFEDLRRSMDRGLPIFVKSRAVFIQLMPLSLREA